MTEGNTFEKHKILWSFLDWDSHTENIKLIAIGCQRILSMDLQCSSKNAQNKKKTNYRILASIELPFYWG